MLEMLFSSGNTVVIIDGRQRLAQKAAAVILSPRNITKPSPLRGYSGIRPQPAVLSPTLHRRPAMLGRRTAERAESKSVTLYFWISVELLVRRDLLSNGK